MSKMELTVVMLKRGSNNSVVHLSQKTAEVPYAQSIERMSCTSRQRGGRHDDCSCHREKHGLQHYWEGVKHEV